MKTEDGVYNKKQLLILYGTQTGTAENYAKAFFFKGRQKKYDVMISSLADYKCQNLITERNLLLFIVATTGKGDPPDDINAFWSMLMSKRYSTSLQNILFYMIGLGDSSYTEYNYAAKKLFRRLKQLGACALLPICLADEQHDCGPDGFILPWSEQMWQSVSTILKPNCEIMPSMYTVVESVIEENTSEQLDFSAEGSEVKVKANTRITPENHWQDVRLIELIGGPSFQPNSVVNVLPWNSYDQIQRFSELTGLNLKQIVRIKSNITHLKLFEAEKHCKIIDLLKYYFDISSVPRKFFFEFLGEIATNEEEKERLQEFAAENGYEDWLNYCSRPRRNIIEVLEDFPLTAKLLTLPLMFEIMPTIRPRSYSIASNYKYHNQIDLLVAIVKYKSSLYRERRGLCSNWLANLKPGSHIKIKLKTGTFRLPNNGEPIIMIGPGTGVAPFRNIVYERYEKNIANNILYFGCRNKGKDNFFENEWKHLNKLKFLEYFVAFSRDQPEKYYVQDKMMENDLQIFESLTQQNATVLIAGNSLRMPEDVIATIVKIFEKFNKDENINGTKFINLLKKERRLQTETWS